MDTQALKQLASLVRYYCLYMTTRAGSGHPTSSLSAADIMTALFFGGMFKFDAAHPDMPNNDRIIFSKGHASPLFYALWTVAGALGEKELDAYRTFDSTLEGHPSMRFAYTEAATGSLGQGLSIGVGMALNAAYLDALPYTTYVLLGDSEMAEGSVWEAMELASYYQLDNLVGIIDVNRLGQRGETMLGHDMLQYQKRVESFGWKAIRIDGHNMKQIDNAFNEAAAVTGKPCMIIAKTQKGKGVPFIEDKEGWHGKSLNEGEFKKAVRALGDIDTSLRASIAAPRTKALHAPIKRRASSAMYAPGDVIATRKAYGNALARLYPAHPDMVVLDAETSNSTYAQTFKESYPKRFFEMFIAEQNMVGTALGLSRRGKRPFVSTFAAFFTRAFDQIRMCAYSNAPITFAGSHAGVSIGEDGFSQMGLEDIALFRAVYGSVVLYPSDAVATEHAVEASLRHSGITYIRTTRADTPVIYAKSQRFEIGKSVVLQQSDRDAVAIIAAGITLFEALKAYEELRNAGIRARIIDCYCIKPIDEDVLFAAAADCMALITVEDHYDAGGLGEAVAAAVSGSNTPVHRLAVRSMPRSGSSNTLLAYEDISSESIVKKVKEIIQ